MFSSSHLSKIQPSFKPFLCISSDDGNKGKDFPVKGSLQRCHSSPQQHPVGYGCPRPWWHFSMATFTGGGGVGGIPAWPRRWHIWYLQVLMQVGNTDKKCCGACCPLMLDLLLSWRLRPGYVVAHIKMPWDCMLSGAVTAAEISKK